MLEGFWQGKRVLVTGHTGFKGGWLSVWLQKLQAEVVGIALDPLSGKSLYQVADVSRQMTSLRQDIRDRQALFKLINAHQPEVIFHLAAQPLVRDSYHYPVETWETNVMGSINVLEAARSTGSVKAVVMVTSDKCYQNNEW